MIAARKTKLGRPRAEIGAGETAKLKLRIKRKGRRFATRALRRGRKVRARIRVVATDEIGQSATAKRKVRLRVASRR